MTRGRHQNLLLKATFTAMLAGVLFGWVIGQAELSPAARADLLGGLEALTTGFLRLIRMVVGPLVLTTLIAGVAQMGGSGTVGRVAIRAVLWFVLLSLIAILCGLVMVNLLGPGVGMNLAAGTVGASPVPADAFSLKALVEEFTPVSIVDALGNNRILQIVVFAIFAGAAISALGEHAAKVLGLTQELAAVMMRIAGYVVLLAPCAVFSALAATVVEHGLGSLAALGRFVIEFYIALGIMAAFILAVGFIFLGKSVIRLVRLNREPMMIALSTSSSEAAFPSSLGAAQAFGVSPRVAAFVLPLGYAFNLVGSMVYLAFAVIFIAQAYGIDLPIGTQIAIMTFLFLATKGAAGIPRAGLLVLATALHLFGLPAEGVALVLAVDALLDMGRTAINVFGNAIACAAIARATGELHSDQE